jgi:hypothetical protein
MKIFSLTVLLLLITRPSFAQFEGYPREGEGNFTGGFGINWIDGDPYYSVTIRPEISLANFGVGLDLKLDFNESGQLRKENFNEFSDYISVIRYLRYGYKNDPLYVKLGALDYYTLGHGSIIYRYNNSPGFDARKIGLVVDLDFGYGGIETIYSRFGEAGVLGLRGYTRPFRFTSLQSIPLINNIEAGVSFAGDYNAYAGVTDGYYEPPLKNFVVAEDKGSIEVIGADIGVPIPLTDILELEVYIDYAHILNFGSGAALGAIFNMEGEGLLDAYARLERRFNGKNYMPSYFNSLYEVERFTIDETTGGFTSKASELSLINDPVNGYFGEAGIKIFNMFEVVAGYQGRDKSPMNGVLHVTSELAPQELPFVARAGYDKINIDDETAVFKLDENSYLYTELGYKPYPFLLLSVIYSWTYTPLRDNDNKILGYETQKRIEPRVSFVYPFKF